MNIFSSNSLLGRFLNALSNIVILNFLWLLCSLPIFTIGASTTAMYYSFMRWLRRDDGYIHVNFFSSFKKNFKQSTIIWLIMLAIGLMISFDFRIGILFNSGDGGSSTGKIILVISVILAIYYSFVLIYIFPILAKFENTIKDTFKNALLMPIAHLGYTSLIYFFIATFIVMTFISRFFIGVEVLTGFGLYGFLTTNIFITIFRKYLPDEIEDDAEVSGINKIY